MPKLTKRCKYNGFGRFAIIGARRDEGSKSLKRYVYNGLERFGYKMIARYHHFNR